MNNFMSSQVNKIEAFANVREQLFEVKKIQLHSGMEGFESPDAYGVYRSTGGNAMGVVGKVYEPLDLNLFLDVLERSIENCNVDLDISTLSFRDYGSKVQFEIEMPTREISSGMKGDILAQKLIARTGFDGLTKTSLNFHNYRVWCSNGAKGWACDFNLAVKNTVKNHVKVMLFCEEIFAVVRESEKYVEQLNQLAKRKVTQKELDTFLTKLTGYDVKSYSELNTKRRNILDRINESVAIEAGNTGWTEFSLLQGITRYTTHDLCGGDAFHADLQFANAAKLSDKAHALLLN